MSKEYSRALRTFQEKVCIQAHMLANIGAYQARHFLVNIVGISTPSPQKITWSQNYEVSHTPMYLLLHEDTSWKLEVLIFI